MSVANEIQRLQTAKADLKTAIENKGVSVSADATLDSYADYVGQISGGGGNLQSKTISLKYVPSGNTQTFSPDAGYDGFSQVTVNYTNVKRLTKTLNISENGQTTINFSDEGSTYFGYGTVNVNVNVPTSGGSADYGALIEGTISQLSESDFGSATQIREYAFYKCSSLASVDIPSGVTSIGASAFNSCSALTSVDIPNSVTTIGTSAFNSCSALTSVDIPNSVTTIGDSAFQRCTSLTSIVLPSGVTSIGINVFQYCYVLASVDIPSGVTSIGASAFQSCTSLTSVELPSALISVGGSAFSGCTSLASVDIPSGVTSIGNSAFMGCTSLSQITCEAVTPPTVGKNTFNGVTPDAVYVPAESVDVYKAAQFWSAFADVIQAIPE